VPLLELGISPKNIINPLRVLRVSGVSQGDAARSALTYP
jgi:hypothetical protein